MVEDAQEQEIYSRVKAAIHSANRSAPVNFITADTRLQEDLDIDSIRLVELILSLEDEFGIHIDDSAIEKVKTVGDVVSLLQTKSR